MLRHVLSTRFIREVFLILRQVLLMRFIRSIFNTPPGTLNEIY